MYLKIAERIESIDNNCELNALLIQAANQIGVPTPWGACSLDSFMNNKDSVLRFIA